MIKIYVRRNSNTIRVTSETNRVRISSPVKNFNVFSQGKRGFQGDTGPVGPQGPQGIQGEPGVAGADGADGIDGVDGEDGVGVPSGGVGGFLLAKASNADFDTEWINPNIFASAAQGVLAFTAIQPGDNISQLVNDAGYVTSVSLAGFDTDDLAEGSTNLYYTDARVQSFADARYIKTTGGNATGSVIFDNNVSLKWEDSNGAAQSILNLLNDDTVTITSVGNHAINLDTSVGGGNINLSAENASLTVANDYIQFDSLAGFVFNQNGIDTDFRIEGLTDQNTFFLDASTNRVGIGTNTPSEKLSVVGNISVSGSATIGSLSGVLKASAGAISGSATTSDLSEGSNLYWTQARFDTAFSAKDTDDLAEGSTNLYYTDVRADARITAQKAQSNGLATLDGSGKIPTLQLPALAITDTFVVASQSAMLALSAETGDVAVRTDLNKSFILMGSDPATLADWQELLTPTDSVLSVNGQTGAVTLTTSDISEGTNLYHTTARVQTVGDARYLRISNNLSDLNNASTARTNLGLGTMAVEDTSSYYSSSAVDTLLTGYVLKSGSITQISSRSHTDLSDIGTNTHDQIDTHIAGTGTSVHGDSYLLNTGDTMTGVLTVIDTGTLNENIAVAGIYIGKKSGDTHRIILSNGTAAQNWQIDNNGGALRFYVPGSVKASLDTSGNLLNSGYLRVGNVSAPTNTSSGDVTVSRIRIGDNAAFGAGSGHIVGIVGTLTDTASGATMFVNTNPTFAPTSNSSAEFRTFYQNAVIQGSTTSGSGALQTVAINAAGSGYTDGDVVTVGGGTGGTLTLTVSAGTVTAVRITTAGTGYTSPTTGVTVTGGTGTGLTINISRVGITMNIVRGVHADNRLRSSGVVNALHGATFTACVADSTSADVITATNVTGISAFLYGRPTGSSLINTTTAIGVDTTININPNVLTATNVFGFRVQNGNASAITNYVGLEVQSLTRGSASSIGARIRFTGIGTGHTNEIGNTTDAIAIQIPSETVTMGNQTATTTNAFGIQIGRATYSSTTNTRTITNAAGLYIANAPLASTNVSITNGPYALWIDDGTVRFDGNLHIAVSNNGIWFDAVGTFNYGLFKPTTAASLELRHGSSTIKTVFNNAGDITLYDGGTLVLGSTTGTKIGTATTQKLGFYNATPIERPSALTVADAGSINSGDATTDTIIANMRTRINELESRLQSLGLIA